VKSLVGEHGVIEAMLDEWAKRFPPPRVGKPAKAKASPSGAPRKRKGAKGNGDAET
jgi:hypothetical protein